MPLYDVTGSKDQLVDPDTCEEYVAIQALQRKLAKQTYERIVKTVRESLDSLKPSESSKLVWTRAAALFGESSLRPKAHVDHLWQAVERAVGPDKECLKAVGGLLRMEVARRGETWLVYRRDSGETDPDTGKLITISEYWINEQYAPKRQKVRTKVAEQEPSRYGESLQDQLARHFEVKHVPKVVSRRQDRDN